MENKPKIELVDKYRPLFQDDSRYFVITGGRSSGKSFSVAAFIAMLTFEEDHTILFSRNTMSAAEISIIPEFIEKLELMGVKHLFKTKADEVINKVTNSKIIFRGLTSNNKDNTANLKSLNGVTTWIIEEAEELMDETRFETVDDSLRVKGKQLRTILLLNPKSKEHWIYKRFFLNAGVIPGSNTNKNLVTYIHTTYRDNKENVNEQSVMMWDELEKTNKAKWDHKFGGAWLDIAEGVIFQYSLGEFDLNLVPVYGQDFGFSIDPTTLVKVGIDKKNKKIYIEECFGKPNMTTSQISELDKQYAGNALIVADSAEPRLITEVKSAGVNIKAVTKRPGSIVTGIGLMQDYELIITPDSSNIIAEFNNYVWHDRKSNTPVDMFNHYIDAVRYVVMEMIGRPIGNTKVFNPRRG